jgi:hypothetical protein
MFSPLIQYAADVEHAERVRLAEEAGRLAELAASAPAGERRAWLAAPAAWLRRLADRVGRSGAAEARASGRIRSFAREELRTGVEAAQEEPPAA